MQDINNRFRYCSKIISRWIIEEHASEYKTLHTILRILTNMVEQIINSSKEVGIRVPGLFLLGMELSIETLIGQMQSVVLEKDRFDFREQSFV